MSDNVWLSMYGVFYRHRNLVYAKSFGSEDVYWTNLLTTLGWQPLSFDQVKWGEDHVFSFIIDPIKRRTRTLVDYLLQNNCAYLLDDQNFSNFVKWLPIVNINSMSYQDIWQEYCSQITWIPADQVGVDVFKMLEKFARQHDTENLTTPKLLSIYRSPWILQASLTDNSLKWSQGEYLVNEKRELSAKINNLFGDGVHYAWQYLSKDIDLYTQACDNFTDKKEHE